MRGIYRFHVDCGKHSEIDGELEAEEVALISDEPDDVATFDRLKLTTGYNPLDYLSEG